MSLIINILNAPLVYIFLGIKTLVFLILHWKRQQNSS